MRISKVISIASFILATGAVVASAQDKPVDTTQATTAPVVAPQPAPAPVPEVKAPEAKSAEVKPVGNVYGKIFADWNYDVTQKAPATSNQKSLFELSRVYLGYNYKFNNNFTTDALLDVTRIDPYVAASNSTTNPGSTTKVDTGKTTNLGTTTVESPLSMKINDSYVAYLKTAYMAWNGILPKTTLVLGQLPYFAFDVQESFWAHRYIYKSFMDNQSWASSADLGAVVKVSPIDMLKITGGITNGEGYKANQDAYGDYKVAGAVQVNPVKDLTVYVYGDFMPKNVNHDSAQKTIATFVGYKIFDMAKIGLEYNYQFHQGAVAGHDVMGTSIYGMYNIIKELEVFARYDYARSEHDWNSLDNQTAIAGLQYCPISKVKLALDYQRVIPRIYRGSVAMNKIFANCEFDY
jgi:hypothetical protein